MTKRHPAVRHLWVAVWLCFVVPGHAQPMLPGAPLQTSAGVVSRAIAGTALAPVTASGAGQGDLNPGSAPQPHGPIGVPFTGLPGPAAMLPAATLPATTSPATTLSATGLDASASNGPTSKIQAGPVPLATRPPQAVAVQGLTLEAGTGRIVSLDAPAASVFGADPRVAEVRPASPTSLFVLGVAPGRTTIAAIGDNGRAVAQYDVFVLPSSYAAAQAASAIGRLLPGRNVQVAARPNGLVVSGTLQTAAEADEAVQTARGFVGTGQTVESRIEVLGSQQVNLRVRIAEVSRNVIRQLGINWSNLASLGKYAAIGLVTANPLANTTVSASTATAGYNFPTLGHMLDINGIIDAMAQDQLVHVLAEPNLTAISGETASFLVGGEFPIPIAQQNNQVTIEFKQYGVSLAFVPTVLSGERINMKVRPEVSALTTEGAVQIGVGNSAIQVPALTVRRAETTVELASGQSFAIAGLLQDNTTMTGNAVPGLGEVPVLGALFRSDSFQRNETELVIVITPYLVTGVANPAQLKLPTDGWKPPSDLERILLLRQSARGGVQTAATPHIPGDAGFVVQ
jgi:pilus assembly protein CpaC